MDVPAASIVIKSPEGEAAARPRLGHVQELDGLRGVAILLVCLFHFSFVLTSSAEPLARLMQRTLWLGWCGVDLFFALSGFLITGILVDTQDSPSYFRTFYLRRSLRIFPLYFAFLALMLGVLHHFVWRHKYPGITTWWYLVYLQNWKPNHTAGDLHVDHLWSLAVEEQFYFVWPLLMWRPGKRTALALTVVIAAIAMVLRIFFPALFTYEGMYRGTLTRMDALALGAFMAIGIRMPSVRAALRHALPFVIPLAAALLGAAFYAQGNFQWDRPVQVYGAPAMAVLFASLVFWCAEFRPRVMRNRFLGSFAKYAYAIYVFHSPLNQILLPILEPVWRNFSPAAGLSLRCVYILAMSGVSWCLAWLSWRYFEGPINALKSRAPYASKPVSVT